MSTNSLSLPKKINKMSDIKLFKLISTSEALSFLILLFIGMPLKYMADNPILVKVMGPIHGVLFVIYVFYAFIIAKKLNWTKKQLIISILCSILPFGPFYVERNYLPKTT